MTMFGIARPLGNRGRWQSHPYWHRFGDRRVRTLHETFLALIERLTMIREIQLPIELTQSVQPSRFLQLVRKARKVTCRISAPPEVSPHLREKRPVRSEAQQRKIRFSSAWWRCSPATPQFTRAQAPRFARNPPRRPKRQRERAAGLSARHNLGRVPSLT